MGERIALGFCNNIDYEIEWDGQVLAERAARHHISAAEADAGSAIRCERDLLLSILGFMRVGQGGERFVSDAGIIERFAARFNKRITLGGTSVRAAIAMSTLGYSAALHLITKNDEVRQLLPAACPFVCSNKSDSYYPHLIVQFEAGDTVRLGKSTIRARQSNRLIYHCNADRIAMKIAPEFADMLAEAQVLLISGFNAMQSESLLRQRLATVSRLLRRLPAQSRVFLEDGGYHNLAFRRVMLRALGQRLDMHSMNEDELQAHLGCRVALRDADAVYAAVKELNGRLPAATLILHTRQWALAFGRGASRYAGALKGGITMATTRFRHGDSFSRANYHAIERRAPADASAQFAHAINALGGDRVCCLPVAAVRQENATTIGLGDAFVGGFLPALLR